MSSNEANMNPVDLRVRYTKGELLESEVPGNPYELFKLWFSDAQSAEILEPNAMTLSSINNEGYPNSRIVLLKGLNETGFVFYTNYLSQKANDLDRNPKCSLVFLWKENERQVRIVGNAIRQTHELNAEYFASRPRESQIGAWASKQSNMVEDRETLIKSFKDYEREFHGKDIPCPNFWGGYLVVPEKIEFWQGRPGRLHDRLVYEKQNNYNWKTYRLYP